MHAREHVARACQLVNRRPGGVAIYWYWMHRMAVTDQLQFVNYECFDDTVERTVEAFNTHQRRTRNVV